MTPAEIRAIVQALDTTSVDAAERRWSELKPLGASVIPYLAEFYPRCKRWQGRTSLVFHSIRYARVSEEAFQLGIAALQDKATLVRYRACSLLAYSLRKDALPFLHRLRTHADSKTAADAAAAIRAIEANNHHLFVDRTESGHSFWVVNDDDAPV